MLAFRVEAAIMYMNVEHVLDAVLARAGATPGALRLAVVDLSTSPHVDLAGARMLATLRGELEKRGIALRIVEARSSVRDMLRAESVEAKTGPIERGVSLADAITETTRTTV